MAHGHRRAYGGSVIESFGDDSTEALYDGQRSARVRRIPGTIRSGALRKLDMLNAAHSLRDLCSPPGNRLERLAGDLSAFYSIRINEQWRIIFRWTAGNASEVRIADYH